MSEKEKIWCQKETICQKGKNMIYGRNVMSETEEIWCRKGKNSVRKAKHSMWYRKKCAVRKVKMRCWTGKNMMSERGERLFLKGKYCAVSKEKLWCPKGKHILRQKGKKLMSEMKNKMSDRDKIWFQIWEKCMSEREILQCQKRK